MASVDAPEVLKIKPGEADIYTFDFSAELSTGETIDSTTVTATPGTGITVATPTISGSDVKVVLTAIDALLEMRHVLICEVVTSLSRTLPRSGILDAQRDVS